MPWQEYSTMSLRSEFVALASQEGANIRALCRRFQISPTTGYKWLRRAAGAALAAPAALADRSRRPHASPGQTAAALEAAIVAARDAHPAWGGRKLHRWLADQGQDGVPAASTITAILRRRGRLDPAASAQHRPFVRFEHAAPNQLWQLDFKGHVPTGAGRCHPFTVLDDHSRFLLGLFACADEQRATVQAHLTTLFRRYGLPERILCDNGGPWGTTGSGARHSQLSVWLLRLGIAVSHGRPRHPQTQGKDERLHRTLVAELLGRQGFRDLFVAQAEFDGWRTEYNEQRPHEALAFAVPASRYQPSPRPFPEALPPLVYAPDCVLRRVNGKGELRLHGQRYDIGGGFAGQQLGLRPTATAGTWTVQFLHHEVARLDEATRTVTH